MWEKYFWYGTYLNYILHTVQLLLNIEMISACRNLKYVVPRQCRIEKQQFESNVSAKYINECVCVYDPTMCGNGFVFLGVLIVFPF